MARWLVLVAAAGCYHEPRPACGFVCGEASDCPGGYTCNAADNRCHLDGTSVECDSGIDASIELPDTTPPVVVMQTPANGATEVPLDATIVVVFSERVGHYDSQVGFSVQDVDGQIFCSTTTTSEADGFHVTYMPQHVFTGRAVLTASLTAAIVDDAGNPLAPTSWSFTTERDSTPPVITGTVPTDGGVGSTVDPILVFFNEPIKFAPDSITLSPSATGTLALVAPYELAFTPDPPLATSTAYSVTVATTVTDLSDNPLTAPLTFSFTTGTM